jgi:hypothetical protein
VTDGRACLDRLMTEKQWMQQVVEAARANNWMVYHTFDSRRSEPGFPDLLCIRDTEMLAIELKRERGTVTLDQERWLRAFSGVAGLTVMVARPSQWGEVEAVLKGSS